MHHKLAAITALAILGTATACQPTSTSGSATTATATAATGSNDNTTAIKAAVPNFIGMGLQSAQDTAQKAGFYALKSHDALGRARHQILDRDWKVCSQNIKAGSVTATDTELDFGAAKLKETCPAGDQAAPSAASGTMPNFKNKSVAAARQALDSGTSITVEDASSDGRAVLVESNWQVCTQTPAVGTALDGQPVEFTAVKFGETCP